MKYLLLSLSFISPLINLLLIMTFEPKYLAVITINNTVYEYYSDTDFNLALIEQEPTLKLQNSNNAWQLINYLAPHTVKLEPIHRIGIEVSRNKIDKQLQFILGPYKLTIDSFYKRGGEAVVYKGTLDQHAVVIKTYIKGPRTLPWISQKLATYTPMKYMLFEDLSGAYFVVMEELRELVYDNNTLTQGLAFINLLESIGTHHGDISPANVMQDAQGNVKFIDFARFATLSTLFYNKGLTDRKGLTRTLLSYKYQSALSTTPLLQGAEPSKPTLGKLYRAYLQNVTKIKNESPEKQLPQTEEFFDWFQQSFVQDKEGLELIAMAR